MKRGLSAIVLFAFLIIASVNFIIAQNENLSAPQRGLQCLEDILETQLCGQLSVETETFVLLATDECQSELEDDMDATNNCWPAGDCDILTTARAIFALSKAGVDTSDSEAWLLAQNQTTDELTWYLQIETESQAASCTINYNSNSDEISVNADNTLTITRGASGCFNLARDNYWLEVNSNCFDSQFEISCNQDFATTLLFQKPGSDTIHISSEIHSSSSDTPTYEKVNSVCFANPGEECNYEGSLWAAFILNELDYREEIIPYAPYLITIAEDNSNLLPDAFLYRISGFNEYKDQVMDLQTPGGNDEGSWGISTPVNRHYDTALAMFLLNIRPDNAISWLEDNQDDTGCWNNNNLIDTSFILYSAWYGAGLGGIGGGVTPGDGTTTPVQDCEPSNGYCSDALDCIDAGGNALDYDCTFGLDCCSINPEKSCSDLGGDICFADEDCSGDETYNSVDQKSCCLTGSCVPSAAPTPTEEETECKKAGGGCYTSCTGNEEESTSLTSSCDSGEKCCVAKAAGEEAKSYWWIWVLLILILLIILAIVFRDKLRPYWEKLFKKKPTGPRPSTLGLPSAGMPPAMPQRRILPPSAQRPMPGPRPAPRPAGQTDDVLKKLREMGK